MLPQKNRLKKRKEFAYIHKNGTKIHSKNLSLTYTQSKFINTRVGFVVSNKVGNAVVRNQVKRRMRETIRQQLNNMRTHQNLVFIAHPSIVECDFSNIKEEITQVLNRGKLLNE